GFAPADAVHWARERGYPLERARAYRAAPKAEKLRFLVEDLKADTGNAALRAEIIKLALALDAPPPVPDDAKRFMVRGVEGVKDATNEGEFRSVAAEFQNAADTAPWWSKAYYNLALAQDKAGLYAEAVESMKLYLAAEPDAPDIEQAKELMFKMEYRRDRAARR
ncbi:MAG: hypothetical protein HYV15_00760, partial [Elusimicrobia bacterium]|nr:hypothetical protein [Elusimicrobiota bacterium]